MNENNLLKRMEEILEDKRRLAIILEVMGNQVVTSKSIKFIKFIDKQVNVIVDMFNKLDLEFDECSNRLKEMIE